MLTNKRSSDYIALGEMKMIKAKSKKMKQYLLHAEIGETIGEINGYSIVKITRGDDIGYIALNDEKLVVDMFVRCSNQFTVFDNEFKTNEEKLEEISDYMIL